ncbi:MAG: GWxTD domain-containing protein [Candidatus Latescibacteria bacterium]|nr:GWxTD domain-containing protein [Candidatus Latescibacterota bacterium]
MRKERDPVLLEWNHFAQEDLKKALSYLGRSITLDPRLREAYYHLGVICVENSQPEALVSLAEQLLKQYPEDKDALLFCGLGHQTAGSYQKAYEFYTEALKRMSPEERTMMESVDLIATEKEQRQMLQAERQRVFGDSTGVQGDSPERDGFWHGQDPLFLTEFNENRMEHYSRVAYANLRFSQPSNRIAGWQTGMGKTYIRFGQPLHQGSRRPSHEGPDPNSVGSLGGKAALSKFYPHIATWSYEGFQLKFAEDGMDGWSFAVADVFGGGVTNLSGVSPQYVFRDTPPRYVDPYRGKKYSVPHQVAAFRQGDSVRVEFSYAIPKGRLRTSDSDSLVDLEDGVFLFDERWKEVYRDPRRFTRLKLPVLQEQAEVDSLLRNNVIFFKTLRVGPGPYHMAVEVREKDTESIGTFRDLRTFSFADTSLMMSDLLLASRIERRIPIPERREDLAVMPNPLRTYYRSNPVSVYFEVYNLKPDGSGKTEYDVSYRISRPEKQEVDPALFVPLDLPEARRRAEVEMVVSKISASEAVVDYHVRYVLADRNLASGELEKLERGDRRGETEVTARYAGGRRDDFAYLQIDVGQMPAGVYKLRVKVRDAQTGRSAERETLFRVIQ